MPIIITEFYCKNCDYSFVNSEDIPDDQDVISITCVECGFPHYIHVCEPHVYSEMSVREQKGD